MPRLARVVLANVPHHVTQRGVDRRTVFFSDTDRRVYLELVKDSARQFRTRILGYCLMPNHVHWIVVPAKPDSLCRVFGQAHCRYAHYANTLHQRTGHFWQNRFFSCALDTAHLWAALRYVERNPVRAQLVEAADDWPWSSAAARIGTIHWPSWLDRDAWSERFDAGDWRTYLDSTDMADADLRLRLNTYSGRPAGSAAFVATAESMLDRRLKRKKGGRPRKVQQAASTDGSNQSGLFSDA